jgi:hypothetical protein
MKSETDQILELFKVVELDPDNSSTLRDGCIEIEPEYELMPSDFIKYAELDLDQKDDRSLVNALSNAKRAIDCRTDMIITALRLSPKNLKMSKFNILKEMSILAPRIIDKIRTARNLLEHEYSLPDKALVEDAVDVAMLYEAASQRVFYLFPELIHIANHNSPDGGTHTGYLWATAAEVLFRDYGFELVGHKDNERLDVSIKILPDHELYFPLMKMYVTAHLEKNQTTALTDFYKAINYPKML